MVFEKRLNRNIGQQAGEAVWVIRRVHGRQQTATFGIQQKQNAVQQHQRGAENLAALRIVAGVLAALPQVIGNPGRQFLEHLLENRLFEILAHLLGQCLRRIEHAAGEIAGQALYAKKASKKAHILVIAKLDQVMKIDLIEYAADAACQRAIQPPGAPVGQDAPGHGLLLLFDLLQRRNQRELRVITACDLLLHRCAGWQNRQQRRIAVIAAQHKQAGTLRCQQEFPAQRFEHRARLELRGSGAHRVILIQQRAPCRPDAVALIGDALLQIMAAQKVLAAEQCFLLGAAKRPSEVLAHCHACNALHIHHFECALVVWQQRPRVE